MNRLFAFFFIFLIGISFVSSLSLSVHVPEKYLDVVAGERIYFEINVKYPENPQRKDLRLRYEILDAQDNLITQTKTLKAVETQASFIDFLIVPENTEKGLYFINIIIEDYEDLSEEVSTSFNVIGSLSTGIEPYFIVLISGILFLGILVVIFIFKLKKK